MPTTVDKIRHALEKRDGIDEDQMRSLAESYRTEVQQVNQRLDDAVMLLRKGLRSEAIQRVEMTPNALDAAAELDFPEWDEWNEILQFMTISLPPKLNHDYVTQINEAIIESLPLEALLRRHRRLAIAKAPLAVRLGTLRQIARIDPSNNVWQDDIEIWEKARLGQIDTELKQAIESEDSRNLFLLHKELTGQKWRVAPASRLVEQSTFAAESLQRQSQDAELAKLAPLITEAFANRDEAAARQFRNQWQAVRGKYNLGIPKRFAAAVAPAMRWLEDLDRQAVMESERQQAVQNLESTLASELPIEDVQKAYQQASRFGEPLPEALKQQVDALASLPAKKAKRKAIFIASACAVAVIALVVIGVMYLSSSNRQARQEQTIDQMNSFVSAGQYNEAITFYDSLLANEPDLAKLPKMIAMQATAREALDASRSRLELFEKLLAQATNDDPSLIDEILLPQLDELADDPGQQARVDELRKRKADYVAGETLRQSDEMIAKVAEFQRQFGELSNRGSSVESQQALQVLLTTIARLPNQFPLGSTAARSKQETLRSQVDSTLKRMKDDIMAASQRDDAIDSLVNSRSLEVYADRLREFSTQSISRTKFIEFQTVIDEEKHWIEVDRINDWLQSLAEKLSGGITSAEAVSLIESADKLSAKVSPNPVLLAMPEFNVKMKEIVGRQVILDDIYGQLAKHPLARIVTLRIADPENANGTIRHLAYKNYLDQNADRINRSGGIGVEIVSDALGGVRNRPFQGPVPAPSDEPMATFNQINIGKRSLAASYDQKWEQTFVVQISDIVKRPELDGTIKEWLVYRLLDAATQGSNRFREMVPRTLQTLQRRSEIRERWYESGPFETEMNAEVKQLLSAELNVAFKRFADPLADLESVSQRRLRWIGFLSKSSGGQIEYHLRSDIPDGDGTLYVSAQATPDTPGANSGATSLFAVGKRQQGHIQLTPNPVHQIPGRPLFMFPD